MLGLVQLPYTLMRVSIRATVAVGAIVGAGVVTTPAVAAGAAAVARVAVELAGGAVELAGGCRRAGGGAASRRHDCQAGTGDRRHDPPAPDPDFTAYVHTLKTLADPGWLHPMATTSQPTGLQGTCLTSPTICNPGH